jgi:Pretoxin HINT domain
MKRLSSVLKMSSNLNALLLGKENRVRLNEEQSRVKEKCETSFYEFVKHGWTTLENREFIPGWHVEALCDHLQATYTLDIRKLLINLPPRTGKSNIMSVFFPSWCWLKDAGLRFLYTSYAQTLSVRDSVGCRRLITSEWYQSLWGSKFHLMSDVNNKLRFDNNCAGYRIASSVGGTNTGLGGDFVVCFPYETMIMTNQGEIPIGKIVEENLDVEVLSYNHETEETEYKPILKRMTSRATELIEIKFEDGRVMRCTKNHPIYIKGRGYVRAQDLKAGYKCLSYGTQFT